MRSQIVSGLLAALSLGSHAQSAELRPESAALDALKPFLKGSGSVVNKLTAVHEIDSPGNIGVIRGETRAEYQWVSDGLLANSSATVLRDGKGSGSTQSVSVCGLIPIVKQRTSALQGPAPVIPIAGAFVGIGLKTSVDFAAASRLVSFRAEKGNPCEPKPGETIAFVAGVEHTFKIAGKTMSGVRTETTTCKAAEGSTSLAELVAATTGEYLKVSCESVAQGGHKTVSTYAFLPTVGQYILLEEQDGKTKLAYRPTALEIGR